MAPLSYSLRQAIFKVDVDTLDYQNLPEIASINELEKIAIDTRNLLSTQELQKIEPDNYAAFFTCLAESTEGQSVLDRLNEWLQHYGYLSKVATDISVPRWHEEPKNMKMMFTKFVIQNTTKNKIANNSSYNMWQGNVQQRLQLKGKVNEIYSKLLAHLRYHFLSLEKDFLKHKVIDNEGDIFFLRFRDIAESIQGKKSSETIKKIINNRQLQWEESDQIKTIPYLIYGNAPKIDVNLSFTTLSSKECLQGIGASAGIVEGRIKIITTLDQATDVDSEAIIVVPYTDSGWSTILSQAGGLISEVGGKLSHGAIIAREYQIPAVMDINHATQIFRDGQLVRLNGRKGTVEILSKD